MNVDLNIGGFIGALVGAAVAGLLLYLAFDPDDSSARVPYRLAVSVLIGCAIGGNFLWGKIFPKSK